MLEIKPQTKVLIKTWERITLPLCEKFVPQDRFLDSNSITSRCIFCKNSEYYHGMYTKEYTGGGFCNVAGDFKLHNGYDEIHLLEELEEKRTKWCTMCHKYYDCEKKSEFVRSDEESCIEYA